MPYTHYPSLLLAASLDTIAGMIQMVSLCTHHWSWTDHGNNGLWRVCLQYHHDCYLIRDVTNNYFMAVRALELAGLALIIITTGTLIAVFFITFESKRLVCHWSVLSSLGSTASITLGIMFYGLLPYSGFSIHADIKPSYYFLRLSHKSWSFYLNAIACAVCLVASGLTWWGKNKIPVTYMAKIERKRVDPPLVRPSPEDHPYDAGITNSYDDEKQDYLSPDMYTGADTNDREYPFDVDNRGNGHVPYNGNGSHDNRNSGKGDGKANREPKYKNRRLWEYRRHQDSCDTYETYLGSSHESDDHPPVSHESNERRKSRESNKRRKSGESNERRKSRVSIDHRKTQVNRVEGDNGMFYISYPPAPYADARESRSNSNTFLMSDFNTQRPNPNNFVTSDFNMQQHNPNSFVDFSTPRPNPRPSTSRGITHPNTIPAIKIQMVDYITV